MYGEMTVPEGVMRPRKMNQMVFVSKVIAQALWLNAVMPVAWTWELPPRQRQLPRAWYGVVSSVIFPEERSPAALAFSPDWERAWASCGSLTPLP